MVKLLSGGEMVAQALEDEDVEFIFGYPGGSVLHVYDALHQHSKIPHILVLGHKTARPGRGIFYKGSHISAIFCIGIADGMADTGVRYPGDEINLDIIISGQCLATPISNRFDIDSFITGSRITVVHPQKSANLHFILRLFSLLETFG